MKLLDLKSNPKIVEPPAEDASPSALLSVTGVSKHFETSRNSTRALDEINFEVREGEFVCLVGPSGCGKSTLLNIVAGLDHADRGELRFDGHRIEGSSRERVVVFQEPALYPWLNVRSNVEFGLRLQRVPSKERHERANRFLDLVNLRRFEKSFIHELSGGMKQRAQLARALAAEPRMLLMDEPFAALDAQTRDVLQEELQQIWMATGSTILFVTHNVREAAILADRVIVMTPSPGRIKRELVVDLPRPRRPETHAIVDIAAEIRAELEHDIYAPSEAAYAI